MATLNPALASAKQAALPMPRAPPVTSAVRAANLRDLYRSWRWPTGRWYTRRSPTNPKPLRSSACASLGMPHSAQPQIVRISHGSRLRWRSRWNSIQSLTVVPTTLYLRQKGDDKPAQARVMAGGDSMSLKTPSALPSSRQPPTGDDKPLGGAGEAAPRRRTSKGMRKAKRVGWNLLPPLTFVAIVAFGPRQSRFSTFRHI